MRVHAHDAVDLQRLEKLVSQEANAKQRDRYRAVLLAMNPDRELEGDQIAEREGVEVFSRSSRWGGGCVHKNAGG